MASFNKRYYYINCFKYNREQLIIREDIMKIFGKIIISTLLTLSILLSAFPAGVFNAVSVDNSSAETEAETEAESNSVNGSILEIENSELSDGDLPFRVSLKEALSRRAALC